MSWSAKLLVRLAARLGETVSSARQPWPAGLTGPVEVWRTAPHDAVLPFVNALPNPVTVVCQPGEESCYLGTDVTLELFPESGAIGTAAAWQRWAAVRDAPVIVVPVNNPHEHGYRAVKELALQAARQVYTWHDGSIRRIEPCEVVHAKRRAVLLRFAGMLLAPWYGWERWRASCEIAAWQKDDPAGDLEYSVERVRPLWEKQVMYQEHVARYRRVLARCRGKRVIEVGSGEGYGAALLAGEAERVIAVDRSRAAVRFASAKYRQATISFVCASAEALPFRQECFAVATSFEMIEHVPAPGQVLAAIRDVLRPDGFLFISTPNAATFPPGNEYHHQEYTVDEFFGLLHEWFKTVRVVGQRGNERVRSRRQTHKQGLGRMLGRFLAGARRLGWIPAAADDVVTRCVIHRAYYAETGYTDNGIRWEDFIFSDHDLPHADYFLAECRLKT